MSPQGQHCVCAGRAQPLGVLGELPDAAGQALLRGVVLLWRLQDPDTRCLQGVGLTPACGMAGLALTSRTCSRPPLAPCPWRQHRFCCAGSHMHAHRAGPPCQVLVMIPRGGPWCPGTAPSVWAPFCCLGLFVEMATSCEPGKSLTPSLPAWPCFPETRRCYLFSELTKTPPTARLRSSISSPIHTWLAAMLCPLFPLGSP